MVLLSAELKAANQNITEMKLTMILLNGKARVKKLKATKEVEGKLNDQKELPKDVKLKHDAAVKDLQKKRTNQKQLAKNVKEKKKKLTEMRKSTIKKQE